MLAREPAVSSLLGLVLLIATTAQSMDPERVDLEPGKTGEQGRDKRPNILVIMVDEQRYPTSYDKENLDDWLVENLPNQHAIRAQGTELRNHYIASAACVPSRTSFFTGHYPRLHGVAYTDGAAKSAHAENMYWLDENTVPTMGNYFREAGYRTFYRGKWHISHEDIEVPVSRDILRSNDENGTILEKNTDFYLKAGRLESYGFTGWIGPEPHGTAESNSGTIRDPLTANQVVQTFDDLEASQDDSPFLLVSSFLNPHDICLFGLLWLSWGRIFNDGSVPPVPRSPTQNEDLSTKPGCQQDFVNKYAINFAPQPQLPLYREFYYYLQKVVDIQVGKVLKRLRESRFANKTVVVFTSDHGDMLGAHGGMHQKWYQAYEETVHVPMYISGPGIPAGETRDVLTSHIDVLPTLLGLAKVESPDTISKLLGETYSEAQPLPGRNLLPVILGQDEADMPVYFLSEDEISEGLSRQISLGIPLQEVAEPAKIEAIVARLTSENGDKKLWKYVRTYEDSIISLSPATGGAEQFELYDLTTDPTETVNLAWDGQQTEEGNMALAKMEILLLEQREEKAKIPQNLEVTLTIL